MRPFVTSVLLALLASGCSREYDPSFDARVPEPAYRETHPIVVFDEAHLESHTADGAYKPLADLLRSDGYSTRTGKTALDEKSLEGVAVLVIAGARGANATQDSSAFSGAECVALRRWVHAGGSLLLVTDHWPYGLAAAHLAIQLGVLMIGGLVEDSTHCDPQRGASHPVFSSENGLLRDHPIVRGRSDVERVRRVLTFTGQSVSVPDPDGAFLLLSDTAIEYPPRPASLDRTGGNERVSMEYGDPMAAGSRAQGVALDIGRGRVVVLGEAGMLRAQRERNGNRVGMNVDGYDNRQLALNIFHWLSRKI